MQRISAFLVVLILAAVPAAAQQPDSASAAPDSAATADAPADSAAGAAAVVRTLELPEPVADLAQLGLRVQGRGELGGAWDSYRPCEPQLRLACQPGLIPRLKPDVQFGVQVGGTISERLHIDVDYDQRREFDAANNINVYYQGLEGEILQRVEVGDVSLELPPSRYLTQGIPAGNFGFKAAARVGPLDVQTVWAQQKGDVATREFRLDAAGTGLVQETSLVLDDADYVRGQFFYLVDARALAPAPHVDPLVLGPADAPASLRPRPETLVLFRDEGAAGGTFQQQAQSYFLADAVADDGALRHSGLFRALRNGEDYVVHASGLWIALRSPLRDDEALAVGYVSETGVPIGDADAERAPAGTTPELRLLRGPVTIHQPNQPTWPYELKQVYRLDGSTGVDRASVELVVSLGEASGGATFREHQGRRITLLRLFGLDDDAPADRLDDAHLWTGSGSGWGSEAGGVFGGDVVRGTFVVLPTLEPFARPPPVPSEGLTDTESAALLGADANPRIYDELDPVVRRSSARFRLGFRYRVRTDGLVSTFDLGALGIRSGSERITVNGRELRRDLDYVIDYDVGTVTLLDPQGVLGAAPNAQIRATWEQNALFQVAPTSVFGLSSRYDLGPYGALNLVGLYQAERSIVARPQLGMEPGAVLLGGANGRLSFGAPLLDRLVDALPGVEMYSESVLDVVGELALSSPTPNTQGATYVDDFEASDETPLRLEAHQWRLGSAPQDAAGAESVLPWPAGVDNATRLVWQDRILEGGRESGFLLPEQIDQQIQVGGAQLAERALYLTLGDAAADAAPRWRSLTTVLSTTGRDLSRAEFLEFYAAPVVGAAQEVTLVVDIGTIGEDAFHVGAAGATTGIDERGRPWGLGLLDEEASPARREVWGSEHDRRGLWDQTCEADRLNAVPLGDERANCTRLNGRPDTEDLNGNGVLEAADGPYHRYVVELSSLSPYLVRDQSATGTDFRLYRIPLRDARVTPVNGASDASWRFVRHVRVTAATNTAGRHTLALARVRISGSRWAKRDVHGVLAGPTGDTPGAGSGAATLRVGPVSQLTDGVAYAPPPGVTDELQDPTSAIGPSGVEYNEKALRVTVEALPPGERGEVYHRYPQQPRNLLAYRSLRLWALPRAGAWGDGGDLRLLVKVGTDARNHYLFQTRLRPAVTGNVAPADWLPEQRIEFERWFELKARAERALLERGPGEPLEVWSEDSTYAVVLDDRARAPNLAAVRELGFAVYNAGAAPADAELWLNDLRLGGALQEPALAGRVDVHLDASGFVTADISYGARGGRYQQLNQDPSYQGASELAVSTTAQLGRFAPDAWGLSMPLTVRYARSGREPIFLENSDVLAARLDGLRDVGSRQRSIALGLRRTTPSDRPLVGLLLDGAALRVGWASTSGTGVTSRHETRGFDGGLSWERQPVERSVGVVPGPLESLLRLLAPRRVEQSAFFERLTGSRLRLTPQRVALSAGYHRQESSSWLYDRVLVSAADDDVAPVESPIEALATSGQLTLRPFQNLTAAASITTSRDLLDPERASSRPLERGALTDARGGLAGLDLGWERDRQVTGDVSYRPYVSDWLRPSVTYASRFGLQRNPSYLELLISGTDTAAVLQRTFRAERRASRGLVLDAAGLLRAALDSGFLAAAAAPLQPIELTWTDDAGAQFDRDLAAPGPGYQLGLRDFDGLRLVDGDTALSALRRDGFRARGGLRLPWSGTFAVGYAYTESLLLDLRAGRADGDETVWPDLRVGWSGIGAGELLRSVTVSAGFARTRRRTVISGLTPRRHTIIEDRVPVQLSLGLGPLSLSYGGSLGRGDGADPTGATRSHSVTHGVSASGRFDPPAALRPRLPSPLRLSARYDYQAQSQCRVGGGAADCVPFIDYLNRRLDLTLSTLLPPMDVGLQLSWTDRRSFVGTRSGSSQLQLGIFGQFDLEAGTPR